MAPPKSSSRSVSVVLPASGCEMIAKVRRLAPSDWSGRDASRVEAVFSSIHRFRVKQSDNVCAGYCHGIGRIAPRMEQIAPRGYRSGRRSVTPARHPVPVVADYINIVNQLHPKTGIQPGFRDQGLTPLEVRLA